MATSIIRIVAMAAAVASLATTHEQPASARGILGSGSLLHAHNCYPEDGAWPDRLDRALGTGLSRLAIEQDVAWAPGSAGKPGRSVVSHDAEVDGTEPTLEEHFFARLGPLMDRALAQPQLDQWPLVILHLDFKTTEPEHYRAVWNLLDQHRAWLTTAERVADGTRVMPFRVGPLMVLTENGIGQETAFSDRVPVGQSLLLFGTTPGPELPRSEDPELRARILATTTPAALAPWPATNYRRWTNFSWHVVERGGQPRAGVWTPEDEARLRAIVNRAHAQGLWIRFYTLNGHSAAASRGWSDGYNFGSAAAVRERWQAAIKAGVNLVATDQYEDFARMLAPGRPAPAAGR